MHTLRFDHRRLRLTAWVTMLVWLFAFTAGVVNACALTLATAGDASRHVYAESVVRQGHHEDAGKVSCLKLCDDESSVITKLTLPVVDLGSILLTMVESWDVIATTTGAGIRQSLKRPASHGPPLVIRFLRLTL